MLYIGDKIFYPGYGAGEIINIEEKEVFETIDKYYVIKLVNGLITMMPVNTRKSKGIRKCLTKEECIRCLEILNEKASSMPGKWLDRYKIYTKTIKTGDLSNMCSVLKDVIAIRKKKKLSNSEENFYEDILNMVSEEISIVLDIDLESAKKIVLNPDSLDVIK